MSEKKSVFERFMSAARQNKIRAGLGLAGLAATGLTGTACGVMTTDKMAPYKKDVIPGAFCMTPSGNTVDPIEVPSGTVRVDTSCLKKPGSSVEAYADSETTSRIMATIENGKQLIALCYATGQWVGSVYKDAGQFPEGFQHTWVRVELPEVQDNDNDDDEATYADESDGVPTGYVHAGVLQGSKQVQEHCY